jgi:hypothetical protein
MARPRVFVSSTFYDLRILRAELELALTQLGFDSVLNERGRIPYEKDQRLEQSCYREISNCDIVVSIIGGRFGSSSAVDEHFSISQMELRAAVELDKQLFVFVDRSVMTEFATWSKNREKGIKWATVDNPKVFEFLDFVSSLPRNNPIQSFDVAIDVTTFLKEQFAGLFQRLLSEREVRADYNLGSQLRATAELLNATVEKANANASGRLPELIYANQPLFQELRTVLRVPYRVFFTNKAELEEWLKTRRFLPYPDEFWDSKDTMEFYSDRSDSNEILKISKLIFDEKNNVRYIPTSEWQPTYVRLEKLAVRAAAADDAIPF